MRTRNQFGTVPAVDASGPVTGAGEGQAAADDVEATMLAARALVAISAHSVAAVDDVVSPPQLRVLVMIASRGPLNSGR